MKSTNHCYARIAPLLLATTTLLAVVAPAIISPFAPVRSSLLAPAVALAQEAPTGETPTGETPADEIPLDAPPTDAPESVVVAEANETPKVLVAGGVSSYATHNDALFWMTESYCAPEPPSVAAAEGGETGVPTLSPEGAAAAMGEVAPAAIDAATDFLIHRSNYAGFDYRVLQRWHDSSGPPEWHCPDQYQVNSNIAADATHVYWVDDDGLVRVPRTASEGDPKEIVASAWTSDERVDLKVVGNLLFATTNRDSTNSGQIIIPGSSALRVLNTETGEQRTIRSNIAANNHYSMPNYDGVKVYFKVGSNLRYINLDGTGEYTFSAEATVYTPQASSRILCLPGNPCQRYVYYARPVSGTTFIYRYNVTDNQTSVMQARPERNITALLATTIPGGALQLPAQRLFWLESFYVPDCDDCLTGITTWSLMRTPMTPNATISNLYNFGTDNSAMRVDTLASNGEFVLWRQNNSILRISGDAAALPIINLRVTGIEVTQGIQDDANSVRLVRGRETWVRVFVESDGADVSDVTMRLTSSQGSGTLYPSGKNFITVKASPDKNTLGDSFLFLLPSTWWGFSAQTFTAVLNPHQLPFEPTYADNTFVSPSIAFSEAYPMKVTLYAASYAALDGNNNTQFFEEPPVAEHFDRIRRTYPLAEDGLDAVVRHIDGGLELGLRVNQMHLICLLMKADSRSLCASDYLMGQIFINNIFPDLIPTAGHFHYGLISTELAFPRGQALAIGYPLGAGPGSADDDFGYYTGHELGHMLNRNHPSPNSDDPATKNVKEGCEHSRSDPAFPYALARIGNGDGTIRGFDRALPSGSSAIQAVLDDVNSFDVMSYCGDAQMRWPSPYTWEGLYAFLRDSSAQQAHAAGVTGGATGGEMVAVYGAIRDGVLAVHAVQRLPNGTALGTTSGAPYALVLRDGSGNPLASYTFAVEDNPEDAPEGGAFALVVPWVAGTQSLAITGASQPWTQPVSASAPVVSAVTLVGAPDPVDGIITLAWSATDADGDTLLHDIQYSSDNGVTWQPALLDQTETSVAIDTTILPGGTGKFRVISSDGVNGGYAESPSFTMAHKPPAVQIMSPGNDQLFNWRETVSFAAVAVDLQDGLLDGATLVWHNQKGALGTGANLATNLLATGVNTVTVTAANSQGMTGSASVVIFVGDAVEGPPAQLVASPLLVNWQVANGETAPQTRNLSLSYIGESGSIAWSATSSAPWLTLNLASGSVVPATIVLTANPAGLAAGEAHKATVTISVASGPQAPYTVVVPVTLAIGDSTHAASTAVEGFTKSYLPAVAK